MDELLIAGYLDRGLSSADRDRVADHLTECAECRHNVAEAHLLIGRVRRPRRVFLLSGVMIAAAASALFVVLPHADSGPSILRRGVQSESDSLIVISPAVGKTSRPVRFVWSSVNGASSYRLTLSEPDGATVWSYNGSDTVAVLPDSVGTTERSRYVWIADAILEDGTRRSTGLRELEITPPPGH